MSANGSNGKTNSVGSGNGNNRPAPGEPGGVFKKGDPRINKLGRSKGGKTIPAMLKRLTGEIDEETGKTKAELIGEKVVQAARKGERWAIELLWDRMEGKPRQAIELSNEDADIAALGDKDLIALFLEQSNN